MLQLLFIVALVIFPKVSFSQVNWYKNTDLKFFQPTKYVSVGFSAQNLKTVTSMFGHTFLIFHNEIQPTPSDHTIEFRGVMGKGQLDYLKALTGFLQGKYELNNLIYKTREYHSDGRDIWLYRLRMNSTQIEHLVANLKKRMEQNFYYSFLSLNCSYYINQPILESVHQKDGYKLATIPIQSVRSLETLGLIESQAYQIPADYNILNSQINFLKEDRLQDLEYFFHKDRDEFQPSSDHELAIYSKILNIKIQNTSSEGRRDELFRIKKLLNTPQASSKVSLHDPLKAPGDSYLALSSINQDHGSLRLSGRGAQRSYLSNIQDNYRFSRFEVFRPVLRLNNSQLIIDEFNLINLESVNQKNFFIKNTDSLIDLSFYNWSHLGYEAHEKVFRFGLGKSLFHQNLALSVFPYLGLRQFENKSYSKIGTDQGLKFILQYNPVSEFTGRFVISKYIYSPLDFNSIYQLEISLRLSKHFSSFVRGEFTSLSNADHFIGELGLAHLF
jgi:hypothetical protein